MSFNWVDIAGLLILATAQFFVAVRFWWARSPIVFSLPMGLWFAYRTSKQFVVDEVPAPEEDRREIA